VKREYDEFKVRVNSLPEAIRRRSDAYNTGEELRARRRQQEEAMAAGTLPGALPEAAAAVKATWMSDGSQWPGTWLTSAPDHSRGDHAGIIQVIDCSIDSKNYKLLQLLIRNADVRLKLNCRQCLRLRRQSLCWARSRRSPAG
jgi:hypothetical protein